MAEKTTLEDVVGALTTYTDVVRAFEAERPEATEMLVSIMEQNKRDLVDSLPTWEDVKAARIKGWREGYEEGRLNARHEIMQRIFGDDEE